MRTVGARSHRDLVFIQVFILGTARRAPTRTVYRLPGGFVRVTLRNHSCQGKLEMS